MESEGAGMKEYIEREALLELYQIDGPLNETGRVPLPVIRQNIMDMPAANVAEVVRCQECDNHSEVDGQHYCKFWRMYCPDDSEFFCKAGQRKEAEHG